jgi:hypothetical protein
MTWAVAYFKSPAGLEEQDFARQFQLLERYVSRHREISATS